MILALIADIFKAGFYILIVFLLSVIAPLILVFGLLLSGIYLGAIIWKLIVEEIKQKKGSD